MIMPPYLIIDSNCLCWISKYAMKGLSYGDMETGIIFGFLGQLKKLAKEFKTNKFVFCWDSKQSIRRKLYPDYKRPRRERMIERTPEEVMEDNLAFRQFHLLRKSVLPKLGFNNHFIRTGYESDDIIASLVINPPSGLSDELIVISTDEDLYQLLCRCSMYNPRTHVIMNENWFKKFYSIHPLDWTMVKQLAGCSSDNVAGIPGVGEIKALLYLRKEMGSGKILDRITSKEGEEIVKRNAILVCLPLPGVAPPEGFTVLQDVIKFDAFIDLCQQYGFASFLKREELENWRKLFDMK